MKEKVSDKYKKEDHNIFENEYELDIHISDRRRFKSKIKLFIKKLIALIMIIFPFYYYNKVYEHIFEIGENLSSETFSEMFMLVLYLSALIVWYMISFRLLFSKNY